MRCFVAICFDALILLFGWDIGCFIDKVCLGLFDLMGLDCCSCLLPLISVLLVWHRLVFVDLLWVFAYVLDFLRVLGFRW